MFYLPTSIRSCGHRRMEFEAKVSLEHSLNLQLPHIHQRSETKTKLSWVLKSSKCIKHLKLGAKCFRDRKTQDMMWKKKKGNFFKPCFHSVIRRIYLSQLKQYLEGLLWLELMNNLILTWYIWYNRDKGLHFWPSLLIIRRALS